MYWPINAGRSASFSNRYAQLSGYGNTPMQTETDLPSAVIIPFPKRTRPASAAISEQIAPAPVVPHPSTLARTARPAIGSAPNARPIAPLPVRAFNASAPLGSVPVRPGDFAKNARAASAQPTTRPSYATPSEATPLVGVMAELDHALTRQGAAVARWRKAINDLRIAMDGLENSLKQYRDNLAPANHGSLNNASLNNGVAS